MVRRNGRGCVLRRGLQLGERVVGGAELQRETRREGDGMDAVKLRPEVGGRRQGPPEPEVWKVQIPGGEGVQWRQARGTREQAGCA